MQPARWRAAAASESSSATRSRCSGVSRRASSIFFCASMSPSLLGRREAFRLGNEDVDFDFIALSYMETTCPSPLRQPCLLPFILTPPPTRELPSCTSLRVSSDHGFSHPLHLFSSSVESPPNKRVARWLLHCACRTSIVSSFASSPHRHGLYQHIVRLAPLQTLPSHDLYFPPSFTCGQRGRDASNCARPASTF